MSDNEKANPDSGEELSEESLEEVAGGKPVPFQIPRPIFLPGPTFPRDPIDPLPMPITLPVEEI